MEKITWIDSRSSILIGKRTYKSGDIIPAGVIPAKNLDRLVKDKKIRIGEPKKDMTKKIVTVLGSEVQSQVMKTEPVKPIEPETPAPDGDGEEMIFGMKKSEFLKLSKDEKKKVKADFRNSDKVE